MRAALIQHNARTDKAANLDALEALIRDAHGEAAPDLVVTPEYATFLGGSRADMRAAAETLPDGLSYRRLSGLAAELRIGLHIGSMLERDAHGLYNTAIAFGRDGRELARYRKIHLLEIQTRSGRLYREADLFSPGTETVTYQFSGRCVGISICFDIRFGGLYRRLVAQGAELLTIPAVFNDDTGRAHWEVLCRARAIETQCFVLAPGQIGTHPEPSGARISHGNSMIVDPWGEILACAPDRTGWIAAELDFDRLDGIRRRLPVARQQTL
ncbi:MAG: carbon-nitrogen hydrolase family protein [Pseudomonadota bacterium]